MKQKILHVHEPLVAHLPQNAMLLSIIGQTSSEYEWIMNNFVNIRANKHWDYDDFFRQDMWYNCYFIEDNAFTKAYLSKVINGRFIDFIISNIDNGYYVDPYINMKHISAYKRLRDQRHSPLIYGYNLESEIFYIADFFENRKFRFATASFTEMEAAFCYDEDLHEWYRYKLFRCFRKKYGYTYEFNLADLITKLTDYLLSTNFHQNGYYQFQTNDMEEKLYFNDFNAYNTDFGLKCYDTAIEALCRGKLWRRICYLFYAHKKIMRLRVEFLDKRYGLSRYSELAHLSEEVLNLSLENLNLFVKSHLLTGEKKESVNVRILRNLHLLRGKDMLLTEILISDLNKNMASV